MAKRWTPQEHPDYDSHPLLLGMPWDRGGHVNEKGDAVYYQTYPSGGCGYTLNRAALKLFVEECVPNFYPNAMNSREDFYVGGCFANFGIHTVDTRDEHGAWRYVSLNAEQA